MRKLLAFVFVLVSFYSKAQLCAGTSGTITPGNPQNLTNPTYSLNPGGFSPNSNGQFVVSPNATTTYTIYTTGTNTANAVVTTTGVLTVTVFPMPISVPTVTQASCSSTLNIFNLNLTFNPASPAPNYTIAWQPIPNNILTPTQITATASAPGPYTAQITAAGGCQATVYFTVNPQPSPAVFSVTPFGATHTITCTQPSIDLNATNANYTYTWTSPSTSPIISPSITVTSTSLGIWTVIGQDPVSLCTTQHTFNILLNVNTPTSAITPTLINITCTQTTVPTVSISATPSVNITHYIYTPQGGTFSAQSWTAIYSPPGGDPGTVTYTYVLVDNVSGCSSVKHFSVNSGTGFPTFIVTSPQNFTLGCSTKSLISIKVESVITNPAPGAPVSYTALPPGTSYTLGTGTFTGSNTFTVNIPGTWTVITRQNTGGCETRVPISIIQNTFAPYVAAAISETILPARIITDPLDCTYTTTILQALQSIPDSLYPPAPVTYNWAFSGGVVTGSVLTVNANTANTTTNVINIYTLTVTDNNNSCKSSSVITMYQNLYTPKLVIGVGQTSLTCGTPTIICTIQSTTGIPGSTGFSTVQPVIGYLWTGPTPQEPLQLSTTYTAGTVGTYTLEGYDRNNGCVSFTTINIGDNRIYPTVNNPVSPPQPTLDCGATTATVNVIVTNSTSAYTYSWSGPPSATFLSVPGRTAIVAYPNLVGIYTVVVTNGASKCATTATMSVVNGSLTSAFSADNQTGYAPLTVNFYNNSSSSLGSSSITSVWDFANGSGTGTLLPNGTFTSGAVSVTVSPTTVYNSPGTYTVAMYSRKGQCLDTSHIVIKVESPSQIVIPNVFTPNGDKINDLFFLTAKNLTEITALIYDRWGHKIFEVTSDTGNIEWDGKNQMGVEVAEGTYFYVITAKGKDGSAFDKHGTVSVYR